MNIHEQVARYGGAARLSDEELLRILVNNDKKMAVLLGENSLFEDETDVMRIASLPFDELKFRGGLTDIQTARVVAGIELGRRVSESKKKSSREKLASPAKTASYLMPKMQFLTHEVFIVILLNAKMEVIGSREIAVGGITSTTVDPREVFAYAVVRHCAAIIVAHNHPSGDVSPSPDDCELTRMLSAAGKTLSIPMLDHIIIGQGTYYSFTESTD